MKNYLKILGSLLLIIGLSGAVRLHSVQEARQFVNTHKTSVILFTASWCEVCQALEEHTLQEPDVKQALRHVSEGIVDCSHDTVRLRRLLRSFKVYGFPTILMFQDGQKVNETSGFLTPKEFIRFLGE